MTWEVVVEPAAERELRGAQDWYEAKRDGRGDLFIECIDEAIERITALPSASTPVPGVPTELGARRVLVKKFPFTVVFIEHDAVIYVVAFAHSRRRPGYWLDRIH